MHVKYRGRCRGRSEHSYTDPMNATEPIDTHEFPPDHEPVEDWQRVERANSAQYNSLVEVDDEEVMACNAMPPPKAGERARPNTTAFAELGTIGSADYGL